MPIFLKYKEVTLREIGQSTSHQNFSTPMISKKNGVIEVQKIWLNENQDNLFTKSLPNVFNKVECAQDQDEKT